MNAYELADELQKHGLNGDNYGLFNKRIQNMLRQQANRIAELEKDLEGCEYFLKAQTKQLSDDYQNKYIEQYWTKKPLSEKELYEVFDKCYPNNGDGDVVTLVDFARAIEERHGIK